MDGLAALKKINEAQPDIVVLDVMMPGMSGIEVCRQLRSQPQTAQLPIIMLSAKGEVDDKLVGFEAGADDYVSKPVARQELLARANALLHRAQYTKIPTARIITFVGAKGGVGTTTVAINVAAALNSDDKKVTIVELQSHPGTMVHHLNMALAQDLGDLLALDPAQLNWREVNRRVVQHASGLRLLTAPQDAAEFTLSVAHARSIVDALTIRTDCLILDIPTVAGKVMHEVLELADLIVLVTEPEIVSVKATRAKMATLHDWSLSDRARIVILSRSSSATMMRRNEIEIELGLQPNSDTILGVIPPAPEAFQQASQMGIPVIINKPHILASRALTEVANKISLYTHEI
jgi:CheY-like chemotaxis protein/MinD-like ATPase involved in chromosome partitioning or flagellar assembly